MTAAHRHDLMENMDDRHGATSQHPPSLSASCQPIRGISPSATLADAILDRLMHNAHWLKLKGESMRKTTGNLTHGEHLS